MAYRSIPIPRIHVTHCKNFFKRERYDHNIRFEDQSHHFNAGILSRARAARFQQRGGLPAVATGMMAQQHGLAAPLLGGDRPNSAGSDAGMFASGGSASAGGTVRYTSASGLSIIGGAAWGREDYASTELKNSWIGADALRYVYDGFGFAALPTSLSGRLGDA